MNPGRELDAIIAKKIMGLHIGQDSFGEPVIFRYDHDADKGQMDKRICLSNSRIFH